MDNGAVALHIRRAEAAPVYMCPGFCIAFDLNEQAVDAMHCLYQFKGMVVGGKSEANCSASWV